MESKKPSRKKRSSLKNADVNANSFIMKFLQAHGLEIVRIIKEKENSELFLVNNIRLGETFILKKKKIDSSIVLNESLLVERLKGLKVEKIIKFDLTNKNVLKISSEIGLSLNEIFKKMNNNFSIKTICNIGLSMIDLLENIHEQGLIHNQISPSKILVSKEKQNRLYLIDFSQCSSEKESLVREKINVGNSYYFLEKNTNRFSSINQHLEKSTSFKDDIESLLYTLLFFFKKGKLFKHEIDDYYEKNKEFKARAIGMAKLNIIVEDLCKDIPEPFEQMLIYLNAFSPNEKINYLFFKEILNAIKLKNEGDPADKDDYDWIKKNFEKFPIKAKSLKNLKSMKTRKEFKNPSCLTPIHENLEEDELEIMEEVEEKEEKNLIIRLESMKDANGGMNGVMEEQEEGEAERNPNIIHFDDDVLISGENSPNKLYDSMVKFKKNFDLKVKLMDN